MRLQALARALRPAQWLKNVPVGAGLVFGHRMGDPAAVARTAAAFASFCAVASAGYLVNDVADREADRRNPTRRRRPIAAGDLDPAAAVAAAVALGAAGLAGAAWWLPVAAAAAVGAYAVLTLAYTFGLRRLGVVGPLVVAAGFVLRVLGGAFAAGVEPSTWLLALTAVLAWALAVAKRESEARRTTGEAPAGLRRATDVLLAASGLGYLAYTQAPDTVALHGGRVLGWTVLPVALALVRFRVLLRHGAAGEGPADVVARDPWLLLLGAAWILSCALLLAA